MKLQVVRSEFNDLSTVGILYVNGNSECYTLEDTDRGLTDNMSLDEILKIKVPKLTAIPYGDYTIDLYMSPKHGMYLPLIKDVPGFSYTEIHPGNKPEDTDGCLLVGVTHPANENWIGSSKLAFERLFDKIHTAINNHELVELSIIKGVNHGFA